MEGGTFKIAEGVRILKEDLLKNQSEFLLGQTPE